MSELSLKIATWDHLPDILDMAERFFQASGYKDLDYDPSKVSEVAMKAIEDRSNYCFVVVADQEGRAKGFILGLIQEQLFNRERTAFELIWWVDPEYRNKPISIKLYNAFEYWAHKLNCRYIITGAAQNTESTENVEKFYNKRNYTKVESSFIKVIH